VFTFKLQHPDGTPADPPTLVSGVPNWGPGDVMTFAPGKQFRVLETLDPEDPELNGVLVVEKPN